MIDNLPIYINADESVSDVLYQLWNATPRFTGIEAEKSISEVVDYVERYLDTAPKRTFCISPSFGQIHDFHGSYTIEPNAIHWTEYLTNYATPINLYF